MESTAVNGRFLLLALSLFAISLLLPFYPLLSELVYTNSGLRLAILVAELLFVILVFVMLPVISLPQGTGLSFRLLALWLVWVVLATLFSDNLAPSLVATASLFSHLLFLYSLWLAIQAYPELRVLLSVYLILGYILYILMLGSLLFFADLGPEVPYHRLFVGFHNIRNFGFYTFIVLCFTLWLLGMGMERRSWLAPPILWGVSVTAWMFLFLAAGRGPFFTFIASSLLLFAVNRRTFSRLYILLLLSGMGAGLGLSLLLEQDVFNVGRLLSASLPVDDLNAYSSRRIDMWLDALEYSLTAPLFGAGPDGYLFSVSQMGYSNTIQPHNLLLQVVLDWGWVGGMLFLLLIGRCLMIGYEYLRAHRWPDTAVVGSLFTIVSIMLFSLIDGVLYHARTTMLFCIALAILLSFLVKLDEDTRVRIPRAILLVAITPLALIALLHGISTYAATQRQVEGLDGWSVAYLKYFPSALADPGVLKYVVRWPYYWEGRVPAEELSKWYSWLENHSSRPALFAYLNAAHLYRHGEKVKAEQVMSPYLEHAPEYLQDAYFCLGR